MGIRIGAGAASPEFRRPVGRPCLWGYLRITQPADRRLPEITRGRRINISGVFREGGTVIIADIQLRLMFNGR